VKETSSFGKSVIGVLLARKCGFVVCPITGTNFPVFAGIGKRPSVQAYGIVYELREISGKKKVFLKLVNGTTIGYATEPGIVHVRNQEISTTI